MGAKVSSSGIMYCPASPSTPAYLKEIWFLLPDYETFLLEHNQMIYELHALAQKYLEELVTVAGTVRPVTSDVESQLKQQITAIARWLKNEVKRYVQSDDERLDAVLQIVVERNTTSSIDYMIRRQWGIDGLFQQLVRPFSEEELKIIVSRIRQELAVNAKVYSVGKFTDDMDANNDLFAEATEGTFHRVIYNEVERWVTEVATPAAIREQISYIVALREQLKAKAEQHEDHESERYRAAMKIHESRWRYGTPRSSNTANTSKTDDHQTRADLNQRSTDKRADNPAKSPARGLASGSDPTAAIIVAVLVGLRLGSLVTFALVRRSQRRQS